jgi:branched-chain amino acid transport system substrate-binding protein
VLSADDQNTPNTALNEVRRLVEDEKVNVVIGSLNSAVALAIHPYTSGKKVPYITGGIAKDITQDKKSEFTFRGSLAAGQQERPLAYYLNKKAGYKRGILMGSDYAAGRDAVGEVSATFKSLGGTVVEEVFPRQGETDYGPFFSRIAGHQADFVYGYFFAADTLRFVKQYKELGLKFPLVITGSAISAGGAIEAIGKDLDKVVSPELYMWTLDTPESKAFVKAYKDKFNLDPTTLSYNGYVSAKVFLESAKKLNGAVDDTTALAKAMKEVTFDGPAGKWRFDKDNNPIMTYFIVRWDLQDGKIVPTVLDKVENVDQYWKPPTS